jgi:hypothetical protein
VLSNAAFDASLRIQNPQWDIRNLDEVLTIAQSESFSLIKTITMPANNYSVVFKKLHRLKEERKQV